MIPMTKDLLFGMTRFLKLIGQARPIISKKDQKANSFIDHKK